MPKQICFLCDSVLSIGGVQRVLAVIASAMSKEHEVTILSLQDDETCDKSIYELDKSDVNIQFLKLKQGHGLTEKLHRITSGLYKKALPHNRFTSNIYSHSSFPKALRNQFISKLNEGNYDLVIGVHAGLSIKLATIRKQLNAKRVIGWMHNSYEALFEGTSAYLPGLASHFKYQMQKLDNWIVLCKADAAKYQTELGIMPTVIYNPLTLEPGTPSNHKSKTFLSIGRMSPLHKGFDILIKAFALFTQNNQGWKLNIVGEGTEEPNLRQLIKENKLEGKILIHPFTYSVQPYYSNATVYVLASRWEGFGLVLIEAMSHHLPIISSKLPVTKEILHPSYAQFFKSECIDDLAKQMEHIANKSAEELSLMGNSAAEESKKYSITSIIQQWEKV
ncbi:MAG: glycosyltransferase [Bacteroidaceae bacterium]|nr:glycosyltransferase [Bacteroidaceae bacterium]